MEPSGGPEAKGPPAPKGPAAAAGTPAGPESRTPPPKPAEPSKPAAQSPTPSGSASASVTSSSSALPAGQLVRIAGLSAKPELNGQIGLVLRLAEGAPDRNVVKTRFGEKSLKHSNLKGGFTEVAPMAAVPLVVALSLLSILAAADVLRSSGRSALGAASTPTLALAWMFWTLGVCGWLYRPCRPADVWLPALSALGSAKPARGLFRSGFLAVAMLFGLTAWLYGELLIPRMADVPFPVSPPQNSTKVTEGAARAEGGHEVATEEEGEPAAATEEDTAAAKNTSAGASPEPPSVNLLSERSILYGYGAAVALAAQGVCRLDGRLSVHSVGHVLGAIGFAVAATQHCTLCSLLFAGARGQPIADAAARASLPDVRWFRQQVVHLGPIAILGMPLASQLFNKLPGTRDNDRPSFNGVLKQSGLLTSLKAIQWGSILLYGVFVGTYACDFWAAGT